MPEDAHQNVETEAGREKQAARRIFADTAVGISFKARRSRRFPPGTELDYSVFKATITSAVEEIKSEISQQHELTRADVQSVRRDVLDAVKSSPSEYIKLMSEFGSLFLVFALVVRFALKIELVNTAFCVFMLFACGLSWGMATLKQRSDKKADHPQA